MKIAVIGCGYVGLVTGTCLAEIGHKVVCTDSDESKINSLLASKIPIYEPGLDELVRRNVSEKRLTFSKQIADAIRFGDVVIICVGTPPLPDGTADMSAVDSVARSIACSAQRPKLVVEKSTVPVRTGQHLKRALATYKRNSGVSFDVASNPEFLREGTAIHDFLHPDRIVVGVDSAEAESALREIYAPIVNQEFACPLHESGCPAGASPEFLVTSVNSAELIKHASNSFLALKISYANLIADYCEQLNANVDEVLSAVGLDPRIGKHFLRPGLGFGGFCLPKDLQAFTRIGEDCGIDVDLLRAVEGINKRRIDNVIGKTRELLWVLKGKRIGMLGLAFKPNTDDIRFSPAVELCKRLLAEQVTLAAYDPEAEERAAFAQPELRCCPNAYEAAREADAIIIATEWEEFKNLDWRSMYQLMARPLIIDARNLLNPQAMAETGFEYHSIGRAGVDGHAGYLASGQIAEPITAQR
jgi:UDPglucose 6-dehydrogenase